MNFHQLALQSEFQDSPGLTEKPYLENFFFCGGGFKSAYLLSVFGASDVKHL